MGEGSVFADAGALIAYGSDFDASHRRIAYFVDRILNGPQTPISPWSSSVLNFRVPSVPTLFSRAFIYFLL